mmetsp:Transcript_18414/g.46253  ORF Transcript_18414/g.46253 Transcript_18414/m.46253 type:complete len:80 (+) Transcript_18414:1159-1398(+)
MSSGFNMGGAWMKPAWRKASSVLDYRSSVSRNEKDERKQRRKEGQEEGGHVRGLIVLLSFRKTNFDRSIAKGRSLLHGT